jgi:opacity protein-like surface antigen
MHVRTPVALAVAALLAAPLSAAAQAKRGTKPQATQATATGSAPAGGLSVGGFIGYESGDLAGLSLRLDGEMPFQMLSPQVALSFVGSVGYTHFSQDIAFGDITYNIFKLVPAARFTLAVNPQVDVYGDGGLGLYYYSFHTKQNVPFLGTFTDSGSGVGLVMRLALGAFYKVNPKLRIGAEFGVLPYFNKVDTTDVTIMAGAMFAI